MENLSLGNWRSLRKGGRYAAPGDFSKINIKQGDLEGWQGYLELLMKKEDKSRWEWFLSAKDGVVNYTKRITSSGINYIVLEITLKDYLPITLFLYTTPDDHLNLYWPGRGNTSIEDNPMHEIYDIDLKDQTNVEILKFGSATVSGKFNASYLKTYLYCEYVKKLVDDEFKDKEFQDLYKLHPYFAYLTGTIMFGPGKIQIKEETFGYDFEVAANIKMMIEDFENRVVLKTAGTTVKPKKATPIIGGKDKQLLCVHPDAADWLSRLFGWKTKGIDTKLGDQDVPIIQFDKGVLYEKVITGATDYAVWPCSSWDETPFDENQVTQLKQLYPGIDCTDVFMSDSD